MELIEAFKINRISEERQDYEVKVKNNSTYVWNGFYDSSLAYLSDKYQQLQAGYAVTRTSSSLPSRWAVSAISPPSAPASERKLSPGLTTATA